MQSCTNLEQGNRRFKIYGFVPKARDLESEENTAADENCYIVVASLDLSMAFDMVNTGLLIRRLQIMGMPSDLICLIRKWLTGRTFYVQVV